MDVGRFCGVQGAEKSATHIRIAEYVRARCEPYPTGFTRQHEWIVEQTMLALRTLLDDVRCSNEERQAVEDFLALASEVLPGQP